MMEITRIGRTSGHQRCHQRCHQWHKVACVCLFLQLSLTKLFVFVEGDSSLPKPSKTRTATRVLGFASSKQSTVLLPQHEIEPDSKNISASERIKSSKSKPQKSLNPTKFYVQHCPSEGVLSFQSAGTIVQISANEQTIWESNVISQEKYAQNTALSHSPSDWVSLEGIFGVYAIPSGTIWVLVTGSETVYEAPRLSNGQSWLSIRRVTDIELVHIPSRLLSVSQLKEEVRQVQLLRKSLKQHDFYYVPSSNGHTSASIVPDMTKNFQRSFRAFLGNGTGTQPLADLNEEVNDVTIENSIIPDGMNTNSSANTESAEEMKDEVNEHESTTPPEGEVNLSKQAPWWENPEDKDETSRPDSRFFWNEVAVEPLVQRYHDDKDTNNNNSRGTKLLLQNVIPLTSAFVGVQRHIPVEESSAIEHPALVYDELLISRRSRFRAGTRFTKRGADATGAVANYAETEQVCLLLSNPKKRQNKQYLQQVSSHVQTRGSIPLRWSSPTDIKTYRPRVRIGMDPMAQTRAFLAHIIEQMSLYTLQDHGQSLNNSCPQLLFVNLIDKKSDQGRLGRAFDAVLNAVMEVYAPPNATLLNATITNTSESNKVTTAENSGEPSEQCITLLPNSVQHLWYDFHAMVKNGRWDRLSKLLKEVKPILLEHGYFCVLAPSKKSPKWKIARCQKAVVRTNCMDCLDRTNVVQGLFGRFMLFHQLRQLAPPVVVATNDTNIANRTQQALPLDLSKAFKKNALTLPWEKGELAHRLLWADNADAISRLYAGTPALKGDFTRTGKRTKRGALDDGMNSLQRYYLNNFLDADRQEGTDLMVGYAPFSNIDDSTSDPSDSRGSDGSGGVSTMTLQEAARQMLLGNNVFKNLGADEETFARIKKYEKLPYLRHSLDSVSGGASAHLGSRPRYRDLRRPALDLRWLPGDLQDNMRSRALAAESEGEAKLNAQFCSAEALAAIDSRAASNEPWWVAPDTSSDEDALVDHQTAKAELGASINHAGYVLSSLLIGTRAPVSMAAVVLALLGVAYLPLFKEDDLEKNPHEEL